MKQLLVSLALLAAGLGSAQGVTIWSHFGETDLEWLQEEAASFEAAFGVPVTITKIELSELKQKMLLAAPQGEAADLVVPLPHDQLGELAEGGVLAKRLSEVNTRLKPLESLLEQRDRLQKLSADAGADNRDGINLAHCAHTVPRSAICCAVNASSIAL